MKKTFERSDTFKTVTAYTYDNNGLLTGSYREYSNGLTAEFNYVFDGNRRLINRTYIRSEGVSGSEKYFFNEKGWLVKGVYENFDSWLTGILHFTHNDQELIQSGEFLGEEDFSAKLDFDYDDCRNVTKIHWDFSFGKTQTYTFEYHKIN